MTLRAKILLAQTPLAGALLLVAIISALTSAALGRNAASILQDNYRSVLAAEQMKEALERIDSAAMFIVAGERPAGSPRPTRTSPASSSSSRSSSTTSPSGANRRPPPRSAAPGPTTTGPTPASSPGPTTRRWRPATSRR